MYHHREWEDVTKFTDGCDLEHRPSVHLFRLTDGPRLLFWSRARLLPLLPPRTPFLQVLTNFAHLSFSLGQYGPRITTRRPGWARYGLSLYI
jgi:hypothetical protein